MIAYQGVDTTSSVIANILRELALAPKIQQKLYEEVSAVGEPLNAANTKGLPYLQAVIDETLRLWNAVPGGQQMITGAEPVTVAGHVIPPRTAVRVSHLSLFTGKYRIPLEGSSLVTCGLTPVVLDERYFPNGEVFMPERWTDKSLGAVKDARVFIPFS